MSTPHTPGPWIAKPTAGHDIHGQSVVYAETGGRGTDVAIIYNGAADADLIAAAPAMKAALLTLVEHAQETYPHFESERGQCDIAAALEALSQANGRG